MILTVILPCRPYRILPEPIRKRHDWMCSSARVLQFYFWDHWLDFQDQIPYLGVTRRLEMDSGPGEAADDGNQYQGE